MLLFSLFFACQNAEIDLEGFDATLWQSDQNGCEGKRIGQVAIFEQRIKPQIDQMSEKDIVKILGKPDRQELMTRGQKIYYYALEAGKLCQKEQSRIKIVQIRFDALNRINEVTLTEKDF